MRLKSPWIIKTAGRLCGLSFRILFKTLKKEVRTQAGASPYDASGSQRYLYSIWHDSAVLAAFGGHHTRTVALTSRHRDGTFVEAVVGSVGVGAVRGSSGRSGTAAARQLLNVAKTHDIVITPDGPRGPRRTMSKGIVYLASKTGNGVVPTAFACANAWEIQGSWTTQSIPKPFSRVVFLAGAPIFVPSELNSEQVESFRLQVEAAMAELQIQADAQVAAGLLANVALRESTTGARVATASVRKCA
jgi:lysophospholipid acyltransferase (LPLAT)-like uncharacterized protein